VTESVAENCQIHFRQRIRRQDYQNLARCHGVKLHPSAKRGLRAPLAANIEKAVSVLLARA